MMTAATIRQGSKVTISDTTAGPVAHTVLSVAGGRVDVMPTALYDEGRALGMDNPGLFYGFTSYKGAHFARLWQAGRVQVEG